MTIKGLLFMLVITLSGSQNLSAQQLKAGDEFTYKSDGVEMVYTVLDAKNKTCQVGVISDPKQDKYGGAEMTFVNGCKGELKIPSYANGYKVVKIGMQAFSGATDMTSVYIPSTVIALGFQDEGFYGQLNDFAFCQKLSAIKVDPNNSVYSSMNSNVIIDKKTNTLLVGCKGSKIPEGVVSIAPVAFYSTEIIDVNLPNSLKEIGESAFSTCQKLIAVRFNEGLKKIGIRAFMACEKLHSPLFPSTLEEIGKDAFYYCNSLTVIKCKMNPPFALNDRAFDKATYQRGQINVPDAALEKYMTTDGWKNFTMFYGYLPEEENNTFIYTYADYTVGSISQMLYIEATTKLITGSFEIPETVSHNGKVATVVGIGDGAFSGQIYLESIMIPKSIVSISNNAFIGCVGLKNVRVGWKIPLNISAKAPTRGDEEETEEFLEGINKDSCILYVPDESVELYKKADGWKEFKNILPESGYTSIHQAKPIIKDPNVYNLIGRKMRSKLGSLDDLPKGVYIINGKKVIK